MTTAENNLSGAHAPNYILILPTSYILKANDISPTFCILPWIHFATYTNGDVSTCCIATQMRDLNLETHSIADIWNSNHFKNTRIQMLQGERVERCDFCYRQEESNIFSHRIEENKTWFSRLSHNKIKELIQQTQKDGELTIKPSTMDLRPTNKCNLRCVMCAPAESSSWQKDALFLAQSLQSDVKSFWKFNVKAAQANFEWFSKPQIINELIDLLPSISHIILGGGEPLMLKEHDLFIQKVIKSGYSKNITLRYHTNGTLITPQHLEQWQYFKCVQVMISIDGTEKVNNYIRFPSKWDSLLKTLSLLDEAPDNIDPQILSTMSLLNFPYAIDFAVWLIQQNYKKIGMKSNHGLFYPAILFWPEYLSITALPPKIKRQLTISINNFVKDINNSQAQRLLGIVDHMNSCDQSHILPQTLEFLNKIDQIRNTNYTQLFSFLDI